MMTYATIMAHLELGRPNTSVLQVAGDLADRLHAGVIGIAACQTMAFGYGENYMSGAIIEQVQDEVDKEFKEAELEFRKALQPRIATLDWRSAVMFAPLADWLAREARCADMVVTGSPTRAFLDPSRHVNMVDLVMQIGRPVLIVPEACAATTLNRMVVAWKDTRESRHAALDALPLLKLAAHVTVVEIARREDLPEAEKRLVDVVRWLKRHGIEAQSVTSETVGDDVARLSAIADERNADLIVAGAYGHSRLREWALGGVTGDLLMRAKRCTFVSH
jgi:nucleotide-binding universal stress UspA family protein